MPHAPDRHAAAALLTEVLAGPARLGSTRLICVDGPAGSGKTTLASLLAATAGRTWDGHVGGAHG